MATILSSKKSSVGSPYAYYTVAANTSGRTPLSVRVNVKITTRLANSASYFGTGKGLQAALYVNGTWHTETIKSASSFWSGTAAHTKEMTFRVSGLSASTSALTGIKFRVLRTDNTGSACKLNSTSCSNIPVTKVSSKYGSVAISTPTVKAETLNQKQAKVTLSGLPKAVGYATKIYWYLNGKYKTYTTIGSKSTATSFAHTFKGLKPNTAYTFKAIVYYGTDSLTPLVSKSVAVTTPQETGTLTLTAKSTYIKAAVSEMFNEPNYTRSIEFYYKKDESSSYKLFSTVKAQGTSVSKNITGLLSNSKYNIKVLIKNGSTILKTLKASKTTNKDTSLVPTADIEEVTQQLSTRLCTISWIVDKAVSGTSYVIQAKVEGETTWSDLKTVTKVTSPITVTAPAENTNVLFRIKTSNASVAEAVTNYSNTFVCYVNGAFDWDTEKIAGNPLIITANEWNRLGEYVIARNKDVGNIVEIAKVDKDDEIKASDYNLMKNLILKAAGQNELMILGQSVLGKSKLISRDEYIRNKKRGDVIVATEIDALRVSVNNIS